MPGRNSKGYSGSLGVRLFKGFAILIGLLAAAAADMTMLIFWLLSFAWLFLSSGTVPNLATILTCAGFTLTGVLAIVATAFLYRESTKPTQKEPSITPVILTTILFIATLALTLFTNIYFNDPSSQLGMPHTPIFTILATVGTAAFLAYAIYEYVVDSNKYASHRGNDSTAEEKTSLARGEGENRLRNTVDASASMTVSSTATNTNAHPQPLADTSSTPSTVVKRPTLSNTGKTE